MMRLTASGGCLHRAYIRANRRFSREDEVGHLGRGRHSSPSAFSSLRMVRPASGNRRNSQREPSPPPGCDEDRPRKFHADRYFISCCLALTTFCLTLTTGAALFHISHLADRWVPRATLRNQGAMFRLRSFTTGMEGTLVANS